MKRILTVAALALAVGACTLITGPSSPDTAFGYEIVQEPLPTLAENLGALLVTGTMEVPCLPYVASRDVRVSGNDIQLTVIGNRTSVPCAEDQEGFLSYAASIAMRAGSYRVRVYHEWRDVEWPRVTALDTTISIGFAQ